jgi:hypothetical protein
MGHSPYRFACAVPDSFTHIFPIGIRLSYRPITEAWTNQRRRFYG